MEKEQLLLDEELGIEGREGEISIPLKPTVV
jgi:hypothetical protein